jgi:hypothetical protein
LAPDEDLCITAHGCDEIIGDHYPSPNEWRWTPEELADYLCGALPQGYRGGIYISACMESIANYSTRLRIALDRSGRLAGVGLFGNNRTMGMAIPPRSSVMWQPSLPGRVTRQGSIFGPLFRKAPPRSPLWAYRRYNTM